MHDKFSRTKMLVGEENFNKIKNLNILVFGLGGVGGFVVEALIRAGIGKITIVDGDIVDISNINRQIIATTNTIGKLKTEVMAERIKSINSDVEVDCISKFIKEEKDLEFVNNKYDYVIDAIDDINAKIMIIKKCFENNIKIISSMGTANKIDPTKLKINYIEKTEVCPLAKNLRKKLRKMNISKIKVLYSDENKIEIKENYNEGKLGSISFVPSVAGLLITSEVIKDIVEL